MNKTKKIESSAFDAMEAIYGTFFSHPDDEALQLATIKNITKNWVEILKGIINE